MYLEYQQSILGAIFLEPSCLDEVSTILKPSYFDERHQPIYEECLEIYRAGGKPDLVTVGKSADKSYLAELVDFVPTASNVKFYAEKVAEFGQRREVKRIIEQAAELIRDGENPIDLIDSELQKIRAKHSDIKHIKNVLGETWDEIEKAAKDDNPQGFKTGIAELDRMNIFKPGRLVIIGARPGMGKSVLGAQIANQEEAAAIFTYEMVNSELCQRLLAAEARVDLETIISGRFKETDYSKLGHASERLKDRKLYFCESSLSLPDLLSKIRLLQRKYKIEKVVIDYLQLCHDSSAQSRLLEIGKISRGLKAIAKELKICVIALSQLNRSLESRDDKRPRMSDLREAGDIEQDADVVIFIYRDVVYNEGSDPKKAELLIPKFRNGKTGFITCLFIGEHQRFVSEYWA